MLIVPAFVRAGDHAEKVLDRKDPNYDSDEERVVVMTQQDWLKAEVQSYKQAVSNRREGGGGGGSVQLALDGTAGLQHGARPT